MSYIKLWHLLLDKRINKTSLMKTKGISATSMAKLSKGENRYTGLLVKVCSALNCPPGDIMELGPDEPIIIKGGHYAKR
jgi:DNA-binding Xre family transcriptional regulator